MILVDACPRAQRGFRSHPILFHHLWENAFGQLQRELAGLRARLMAQCSPLNFVSAALVLEVVSCSVAPPMVQRAGVPHGGQSSISGIEHAGLAKVIFVGMCDAAFCRTFASCGPVERSSSRCTR